MDFLEFIVPWALLLFFISTAVSLIFVYRFKVKGPFFIFNFVNFCAIAIYFFWLFLPRKCDGCGSGFFAMLLFSIFFIPIILGIINAFFAGILFYLKYDEGSSNKSTVEQEKISGCE